MPCFSLKLRMKAMVLAPLILEMNIFCGERKTLAKYFSSTDIQLLPEGRFVHDLTANQTPFETN
jgi:hypothetical protein